MSKIVFNPNSIFNSSQANFIVNKDAIYAFTRSISGLNTAVYGIQPTPQQCIDGVKIEDISANHSLCSDVYRLNDNVDAMKFFAQRPFIPCESEAERDEIATNPLAVYLTPISASESAAVSSNDHFEWIFVFNQDLGWDYIKEYADGKHYLSAAELSGLGEWELIGSTSMTDEKISALLSYIDENFLDKRTGGEVSGNVVFRFGNISTISATKNGLDIKNGTLTIQDAGGINFLSTYGYGNVAFGYSTNANETGGVAIGYGADALAPYSIAINGDVYRANADRAIAIGGNVGGMDSIGIGQVDNSAPSAITIGSYAQAETNGVGIGTITNAGEEGVAIGYNATALGKSIQLGEGVNEELSSLKVFDYQIIDSNGDIPSARLTAAIGPIKQELLDEIDAETERAVNAETALGNRISVETTARETADSALSGYIQNLSSEVVTISTLLSSELSSTTSALNDLIDLVTDELSNNINPKLSTIADLVSAEVKRTDAFSAAVELSVAGLCVEIESATTTLSNALSNYLPLSGGIVGELSVSKSFLVGKIAVDDSGKTEITADSLYANGLSTTNDGLVLSATDATITSALVTTLTADKISTLAFYTTENKIEANNLEAVDLTSTNQITEHLTATNLTTEYATVEDASFNNLDAPETIASTRTPHGGLSVTGVDFGDGTYLSTAFIPLSDYVKREDLCFAISSNISSFEDYATGRVVPESISAIIEWNMALHFALSACSLL